MNRMTRLVGFAIGIAVSIAVCLAATKFIKASTVRPVVLGVVFVLLVSGNLFFWWRRSS